MADEVINMTNGRNVLLVPASPFKSKSMWAVYDHPTDMPEFFVARRWVVKGITFRHTEDTIKDTDLAAIRDQLKAMGLTCIREKDGLPVIETWI